VDRRVTGQPGHQTAERRQQGRQQAPFTDDELARIIRACDKPVRPRDVKGMAPIKASDYVGCAFKNQSGEGTCNGEDLKDLIWLMVYTGYRISDATFFDATRLQGNQLFIRAKKNGGVVFTYIPDWLRDQLLARMRRYGQRPFITGQSERLETVTHNST